MIGPFDMTRIVVNLQTERARMLGQENHKPVTPSGGTDRIELANNTCEFEKNINLNKMKGAQLAAIERALQKAEEGTYGICDHCHQPIEPARLEAIPHATDCRNCRSKNAVPIGQQFRLASVQSSTHVQR